MSKDDLSRKIMDDCGNSMSKQNKKLWWLLMHDLSLFYTTKIKKCYVQVDGYL
jgi:hypothetical protein